MVTKAAPRGFAKGTKVGVEKTRFEIEMLLKKHGATAFFSSSDDTRGVALFGFRLADRLFRFEVRVPLATQAPSVPKHGPRLTPSQVAARVDEWVVAEERRRWRVQLLCVKAKLETIATGETTVEREFLADMVMPNNKTVGQQVIPMLAKAYATGQMPSILAFGTGDDS